MEALARGLDFPIDSREENLFLRYTERRGNIEYLKILTIVNAIITAGNNIVAAVSKSDQNPNSDKLKQSFDALQDLLTPHAAEDRERRSQKAKELLASEMEKGSISFRTAPKSGGVDLRKRRRRK